MVIVAESNILKFYTGFFFRSPVIHARFSLCVLLFLPLISGISLSVLFFSRLRFPGIFRHGLLHALPLRFRQELIDPVYTGNRRLDRLDLHSEILDRGEYLGNIIDDCNRRSHGHAEQSQDLRISGRCEQHHGRNGDRVEEQDHR